MKIFVIGFHKTATSTLEAALSILGYSVGRPEKGLLPDIQAGRWEAVWEIADRVDAQQDNPWPLIYKELDQHYPDSKFILTVRDPDKWIASLINHCGTKSNTMREWIYGKGRGTPQGNETLYKERMIRHNEEVLNYFKNRPNDLLVIDITKNDGWEKLCPFLEREVPEQPFPHANKRNYTPMERVLRKLGLIKHRARR